jgi:uncharacterized protein (TIGR02453 family)
VSERGAALRSRPFCVWLVGMDDGFHGFGPEVFEWFEGLERENTRDYFTRTRALFDAEVRGGMEALLDELADEFGGGAVKVFRQHRDLRFSPDKSPYKTRTYGVVSDAPELVGRSGYAAISSSGLYAGIGYYRMARDQLERYRTAVDRDAPGEELVAIVAAVEGAGLTVEGEALMTAPRGYPRDHPRIELLRRKAIVAGRRLPAGGGIGREEALEHVSSTWRAAQPINSWLDANVGPSDLPAEGRYGRRR